MGRWPRATVLVLCLMVLRAQPAAADAFTDFQIPDHSWRGFGWDLTGNGNRSDGSSSASQSDGSSAGTRLAAAANWFRDAEHIRASHVLRVGSDGNWSRGRSRTLAWGFDGFEDFVEERLTNNPGDFMQGQALGSTEWTLRPEPRSWSTRLGARAEAGWSREARHSDYLRRYLTPTRRILEYDERGEVTRHDRYLAQVDLGIGFGRVRNATGVFTVERMLERLRAEGRLERWPSADALRRLAGIFYASGGFGAVHDQPQKFLWREIERVLREDGALPESGFDAYDLLRVLEPITVTTGRFSRPVGHELGPIVRFEHTHEIRRSTYTYRYERTVNDTLWTGYSWNTASRSSLGTDALRVGARAEWHRPLGLRAQLSAISEVVFDVGEPDERWSASSQLSIARLVDERWFFTAIARQTRDMDKRVGRLATWSTRLELGAEYFLEDRWSLSARVLQDQWRSDFNSTAAPQFARQTGLTFGLGFNRGAFDAPGLIDPVRPLN